MHGSSWLIFQEQKELRAPLQSPLWVWLAIFIWFPHQVLLAEQVLGTGCRTDFLLAPSGFFHTRMRGCLKPFDIQILWWTLQTNNFAGRSWRKLILALWFDRRLSCSLEMTFLILSIYLFYRGCFCAEIIFIGPFIQSTSLTFSSPIGSSTKFDTQT